MKPIQTAALHRLCCTLFLFLSCFSLVRAQDVNLAQVTADPGTMAFDDGKNTVAGYLYAKLEKTTNCCGNDAIYLGVKINVNGTTESVRALTGRNDCMKKAITDLLKQVRWNTATIKATKEIFFEIKPRITCKGTADDNVYQGGVASTTPAAAPAQTPVANPTPAPEQPVAQVTPAITPAPTQQTTPKEMPASSPAVAPPAPVVQADATNTKPAKPVPAPTTKKAVSVKPISPSLTGSQTSPATQASADLPKPTYRSTGDKSPTVKHSAANMSGPRLGTPEYIDGDTKQSIYIKQSLRKAGVCGLVHTVAEITVEKTGQVVSYRLLKTNSKAVNDAMPSILSSLKYKPESVPLKQNVYFEFKADVDCTGMAPSHTNLGQVEDFIKNPDTSPTTTAKTTPATKDK